MKYLVGTVSATFRRENTLGIVRSIVGQVSKFWMNVCILDMRIGSQKNGEKMAYLERF